MLTEHVKTILELLLSSSITLFQDDGSRVSKLLIMEESDLLLGVCAPPPKIYLSPVVECSNMQRKLLIYF
jgi:hypothetical protein